MVIFQDSYIYIMIPGNDRKYILINYETHNQKWVCLNLRAYTNNRKTSSFHPNLLCYKIIQGVYQENAQIDSLLTYITYDVSYHLVTKQWDINNVIFSLKKSRQIHKFLNFQKFEKSHSLFYFSATVLLRLFV